MDFSLHAFMEALKAVSSLNIYPLFIQKVEEGTSEGVHQPAPKMVVENMLSLFIEGMASFSDEHLFQTIKYRLMIDMFSCHSSLV